jgi:hypothetical protein
MPNSIITNKLTELVALRFLVAAGFVTVGAKEHFKDQMVGKRNGQEYTFVIRDAVDVGEGLSLDATNEKQTIVEREVKMSLTDFHAAVKTNSIESVTDMNWDKEVAEPNGGKIANYVVRKAVGEAFPKANTVIVGSGFQPLAEVAAHLSSISSEKMYGFVDPKIQAILTSNGQQFNPVGSPDSFYKQGLLGEFHNVEYRGQRFMPIVSVPEIAVPASLKTYNDNSVIAVVDGHLVLKLVSDASDSGKVIKKGTPIFVDGAFAADLLGDATAEPFAFIATADATLAGTTAVGVQIDGVAADVTAFNKLLAKGGARAIVKEDNTSFADEKAFKNLAVTIPAAGKYACGQVRLDGTYEFCTLDKLDASNSESKQGKVEGITVHENRVINLNDMTNTTRWDIVAMFGVIEGRGVSNFMVKIA